MAARFNSTLSRPRAAHTHKEQLEHVLCYNCGRTGHTARVCQNRAVNCSVCGRLGHRDADCRKQQRPKSSKQLKPRDQGRAPKFEYEFDNPAKQKWRSGQQPDGTVDIPAHFYFKVNELLRVQVIGDRTSTYVYANFKSKNVQIWGLPENVKQAYDQLGKWFESILYTQGVRKAKKFAKINAHDWNEQTIQYHTDESSILQEFGRVVPDSGFFNCLIRTPWVATNWNPQNELGRQLEVLDQIRADHKVYIRLIPNLNPPEFEVIGDDKTHAWRAAERIHRVPKQVLASKLYPYQFCLIKDIEDEDLIAQIVARKVQEPQGRGGMARAQALGLPPGLTSQPSSTPKVIFTVDEGDLENKKSKNPSSPCIWALHQIDKGAVVISPRAIRSNSLYLSTWLTMTLRRLQYFNGYLEMRARIGTCAFFNPESEVQPKYPIEDFKYEMGERNRQLSPLESTFYEYESGDESPKKLLDRCFRKRSPLFYKRKPYPTAKAPECPPALAVTFRIQKSITSPGQGVDSALHKHYLLKVAFANASERYGTATWSLIPEDGDESRAEPISVNILDLKDPHVSCKLSIRRVKQLNEAVETSRIPGHYADFADVVKLKPEVAQQWWSDECMVQLPEISLPKVRLISMRQERFWDFMVRGSAYSASLARVQEGTFDNNFKLSKMHAPHWDVQIWDPKWDDMLNSHNKLRVGEMATWTAREDTFFALPDMRLGDDELYGSVFRKGDGCAEFLRVVEVVKGVLQGKTAED